MEADFPSKKNFSSNYKVFLKGSKGKRPDKALTFKLFDLVDDPAEKNDLAKKHPEVLKAMTAELEKWRASCKHSDKGGDYKK